MQQFRCLCAEKLERLLIAGKKRRDQFQLALLLQPVQTLVHNSGAGLLILACQQFHVAEPCKKIVQLQFRTGRSVGKLGEFRLGATLEDIDEIRQQIIIQANAVKEHLKDITRLRPDRLLRRLRLCLLLRLGCCGKLRNSRIQFGRVKAVIFLLRNFGSIGLGAGFDKRGNAHFCDLRL